MARCDCGKRIYPTQDEALSTAVRHARRFGAAFRAYACHVDRTRWHLTTKPQRVYRPTTREVTNP